LPVVGVVIADAASSSTSKPDVVGDRSVEPVGMSVTRES
jgi:hypothetical protein